MSNEPATHRCQLVLRYASVLLATASLAIYFLTANTQHAGFILGLALYLWLVA